MARELQRYEEEVAAVMIESNERLNVSRADHDRRVAAIVARPPRL